MSTVAPRVADAPASDAPHAPRTSATEVVERRIKPVKWWAGFGIAVLAAQMWTYVHWFASGDIGASPVGPTPIPEHVKIAADFWQVIGAGGAVLAVWFLLIRPWRRTGHMTVNGMLVVAFFQLWSFQDAFVNYTVNQFQWNAVFVNIGSWYSWVPGWMSPRAHFLAEPILFCGGLYIWLFATGMIFLTWGMRTAKRRWPRTGKVGLVAIAMVTAGTLDSLFEIIWLHQGLYSYGGHLDALTLWPSRQYAFPIYEGVLWGITWGALASMRYFKDDRGQMAVERGLETMKISSKGKQALRFLAVLGAVNLSMLLFYNIPYQFFGLEGNSPPRSVTDKSYMTSGVCGIGTRFTCDYQRGRPR